MIRAASLPTEVDLLSLSQFLQQQGLPHRITEESGQQVIYVNSEQEAELVRQVLEKLPADFAANQQSSSSRSSSSNTSNLSSVSNLLGSLLKEYRASPVTLMLIAICLLVALISSLGTESGRVSFLFYPVLNASSLFGLLADINSVQALLGSLTPMFLHFGELHLIFNMLWLWYFGKQLEAIHPRWIFIVLILLTSFVSNTTQYLYSGFNNFGGMSGVVYGLVGYTWIIHAFMPRSYLLLNSTMFVFFVAALVFMEMVASSWIATAAHVGGLLSGLLLGILMVIYTRLILKQDIVGKGKTLHH